jgi:hypothetical protein
VAYWDAAMWTWWPRSWPTASAPWGLRRADPGLVRILQAKGVRAAARLLDKGEIAR